MGDTRLPAAVYCVVVRDAALPERAPAASNGSVAGRALRPAASLPARRGVGVNADAITCVVADDHPVVLRVVCDFLADNEIAVVARACDGEDALARIEAHGPDVALLDVRMPRVDGIAAARTLGRASSRTAVILYTGFGERVLLTEALDAGARGFVLKEAPLGDLVRAIRLVAAGKTFVDGSLAGMLLRGSGRLSNLTEREGDVLRLLAEGLSNERIGARLFISPDTVRAHVQKAMRKLDADTRTEAVATALRRSLIA